MRSVLWMLVWLRPLVTLCLAGVCIYQAVAMYEARITVQDLHQRLEHANGLLVDADKAVNAATQALRVMRKKCAPDPGEKQL